MKTKIASRAIILALCLLFAFSILAISTTEGKPADKSKTPVYTVTPSEVYEFDTTETAATVQTGVTPFNLDMIDTENVENDGSGVYIAVLDSGLLINWESLLPVGKIDTGLAKGFSYSEAPTYDPITDEFDFNEDKFIEDRGFISDPVIGDGHGTHVTSIITGYQLGSLLINGVAPGVTIIPVLVLDTWTIPNYGPEGDNVTIGSDRMVAKGINYITGLKMTELRESPVIISMSLGGPDPSPLIEEAIDNAIDHGVIVVAAAGNAGEDGMDWPGAYPEVISVAAGGWTMEFIFGGFWLSDVPEKLNTPDILGNNWQTYLAFFSSRPNKDLGQSWKHLDVCAPGSAVVGPFTEDGMENFDYYYLWGTSQATPHVSGIAALILQSYPSLDQGDVEHIVKHASRKLPIPADGATIFWPFIGDIGDFIFLKWNNHDAGSGFLQADNAMKSAAKFA